MANACQGIAVICHSPLTYFIKGTVQRNIHKRVKREHITIQYKYIYTTLLYDAEQFIVKKIPDKKNKNKEIYSL